MNKYMSVIVDKEVVITEVMGVIQKHYSVYETNISEMETILKQLPFVKKLMKENAELKQKLEGNQEEHITLKVEERQNEFVDLSNTRTFDIGKEIDDSVSSLSDIREIMKQNMESLNPLEKSVLELDGIVSEFEICPYNDNDNDNDTLDALYSQSVSASEAEEEAKEEAVSASEAEAEAVSASEAEAEAVSASEAEEEAVSASEAEEEASASEAEEEASASEAEEEAEEAEEADSEAEEADSDAEEADSEAEEEAVSEEAEAEEEEEEEVYEITIDDTVYFTSGETNGTIYECTVDGDVGDIVGRYENSEIKFNKSV